jgi:hypothetical protein
MQREMVWVRNGSNGKCQKAFARSPLKGQRPRLFENVVFAAVLFCIAMDSCTEGFTRTAPITIFQPIAHRHASPPYPSSLFESSDVENSIVEQEDVTVVTWLEDDTASKKDPEANNPSLRQSNWGSKFQIKEGVIRAGQEKAIRNKQKRSSDLDRKRRMYFSFKMLRTTIRKS